MIETILHKFIIQLIKTETINKTNISQRKISARVGEGALWSRTYQAHLVLSPRESVFKLAPTGDVVLHLYLSLPEVG